MMYLINCESNAQGILDVLEARYSLSEAESDALRDQVDAARSEADTLRSQVEGFRF